MTVYVLIIEDRHCDVEVGVFATEESAIAAAMEYLEDFRDSMEDVDPDDATMSEADLQVAGWVFYRCYSTEGDCVRVQMNEVMGCQ